MNRCIICGAECDKYICDDCLPAADLEMLCEQITAYRPDVFHNQLWNEIAAGLENPYDFRRIAFDIADLLPTPKREYCKARNLANNSLSVKKDSRDTMCELYEVCKEAGGLIDSELSYMKGLVADALYKNYLYEDAEAVFSELDISDMLPFNCYSALAEYYTITRRYDKADEVIDAAFQQYAGDEKAVSVLNIRREKNEKQRQKKLTGRKEYLPAPKKNKTEIQKRYIDFLNSIGIDAELPDTVAGCAPSPIRNSDYPDPVMKYEADFDSFVAFDLETTGFSPQYHSIIEIGAVRVVNGEIAESKEFTFQEFVKPYRSFLSKKIQELTGISPSDVMSAREMWEVFPDFMDFARNSILVGYNCNRFDSHFMTRAGRYSHIIIKNPYFDVMYYAGDVLSRHGMFGKKLNLGAVSEQLGIVDPEAHRALADAITTAKVYMKLREIDKS